MKKQILILITALLLTACSNNTGTADKDITYDTDNFFDDFDAYEFSDIAESDDFSDYSDDFSDYEDVDSYNIGDLDSVDNDSPCSGNFPNEHNGLCWSNTPEKWLSHYEALDYCLNMGGRLPSVSELRTLIQNCPPTETGGTCTVTDSCLDWTECSNDTCKGCTSSHSGKYSVFGDSGNLWSSALRLEDPDMAWLIYFAIAAVGGNERDSYHGVRCIHADNTSDDTDNYEENEDADLFLDVDSYIDIDNDSDADTDLDADADSELDPETDTDIDTAFDNDSFSDPDNAIDEDITILPFCGDSNTDIGESCDGNTESCLVLGVGTEGTAICNGECNGWVTAANCTRTFSCIEKPANAVWNTPYEYTQTWDGSAWNPADSETIYNEIPDGSYCQFMCELNFYWDGTTCKPETKVDIVGGDTSSYTYGNRLKGNYFYCTSGSRKVSGMDTYMRFNGGLNITYAVYEASTENGTYNLVYQKTSYHYSDGSGPTWYNSGEVSWNLINGYYYFFGVFFGLTDNAIDANPTYYYKNSLTTPVVFGTHLGGGESGSYESLPNSIVSIDNVYGYYMQITTQ